MRTNPRLLFSKRFPQFFFRFIQQTPLLGIQCHTGSVDVKRQHRHGGSIGTAFSPCAGFGGTFQRERDLPRTSLLEYILFEIQSIAMLGHFP